MDAKAMDATNTGTTDVGTDAVVTYSLARLIWTMIGTIIWGPSMSRPFDELEEHVKRCYAQVGDAMVRASLTAGTNGQDGLEAAAIAGYMKRREVVHRDTDPPWGESLPLNRAMWRSIAAAAISEASNLERAGSSVQ